MEKLRTGIIGCGKVGDFHAKVYAELPQSEFVAVCDADSARAEAFASRYGVKAVSYTHLDVYKRQVGYRYGSFLSIKIDPAPCTSQVRVRRPRI